MLIFFFHFFIEMCVSCCDHRKFEYNLACSFKVVPERYTISSVPHVSPEVRNDGWFPPASLTFLQDVSFRVARRYSSSLAFLHSKLDLDSGWSRGEDLVISWWLTAVVFLLRLDFYVSRRAMWLVYKKATGTIIQTNVTTTSVEKILITNKVCC